MRKLVAAAVVALVPLAGAVSASAQVRVAGIYTEPRAVLNPGKADPRVTQANVASTICRSGYTATVRPPTSYTDPLKDRQIRAYGYTGTRADFELDHLIPLELGGDPRAPANLWPEPWERRGAQLVPAGYGAETKDQFENYLHRAVCAGRIRLTDAQRQMTRGWIANARAVGIAAGGPLAFATTPTIATPTEPTTAPANTTSTTAAPPATTSTTARPATTSTTAAATTTTVTTAAPSTTSTTTGGGLPIVTAGAFCSGVGSKGQTVTGLSMTCSTASCAAVAYTQPRWRSTIC